MVIGNGMAGARAVEEILARGGAEQFTITMFGDEPYGNYNRIMLSHVLSGEESDADIFLNSLHWYQDNNITLHAGVRVERIDRFTKYVFANNGHVVPVRCPDHRHGQPVLHAADGRPVHAERFDQARGLHVPHHRRHPQHGPARAAGPPPPGAWCIGGGLLGLEAARGLQSHGIDVDVVHSGGHLMNAQMGPDGGAILRRSVEALGIRVHTASRTTAVLGTDRVTGVSLRDRPDIDCDMVVVAAGIRPNVDIAVLSGLHGGTRHRGG